MDEIGNLFLLTREAAGVSLKEVSEDLNIEEAILENIEDGKSGAFNDVFFLKNCIQEYAKYLGLDAEKVIEEFNEYVFESTSKIPIKEIEKQILENNKNESEEKVISPYTRKERPVKNGLYLLIYISLVILMILAIFWSVKQIVVGGGNESTSIISYGE